MSRFIQEFLIGIYRFGDLTSMINFFLKGVLVLLALLCLNWMFRRKSASIRSCVWLLGLTALMLLPILTNLLPRTAIDILSSGFSFPYFEKRRYFLERLDDRLEEMSIFNESPPVLHSADRSYFQSQGTVYSYRIPLMEFYGGFRGVARFWPLWISVIWFSGFIFLLGRTFFRLLVLRRIVQQSRSVDDKEWNDLIQSEIVDRNIRKNLRLLTSARIPVPAVSGFLKPVLLVPESSVDWSVDQKRMVLLHELAHIRRKDTWVNGLVQILCAFWWPIPFIWTAAKKLRLEQEKACDDDVLQQTTVNWKYASFLLDVAVLLSGRNRVKQYAVGMASPRELKNRLSHILSGTVHRRSISRRWLVGAGVVLIVVMIPVAMMTLTEETYEGAVPWTTHELASWTRKLKNGDPDERAEAAWAMGNREDPAAVPSLIEVLFDTNSEVRSMAAWALGEIKDSTSVGPLMQGLIHQDPLTREMCVKALGEIGSQSTLARIIDVSRDEDEAVRYAAVWALGEMHRKEAYDAVITALTDSCRKVKEMAIHVLSEIGTPEVIRHLLSLLNDREPAIRERAAYALGRSRVKAALESLIELLDDPSDAVRIEAARALGRIGDPEALEAVMALLRDPEPDVRAMAVWAMDEIHSTE